MKTLILHPGALGDVILSIPALRILREKIPPIEITLAGNLDYLGLVVGPYVNRILSLSTLPLHRLYSGDALSEEDIAFWQQWERLLSWTGLGDEQFTRALKTTNPDALVAGWKPLPGETRHVSYLFADSMLPWLGEISDLPHPSIFAGEAGRKEAATWLHFRGWSPEQRIVALHPGAGSAAKRWPTERFRALARELLNSTAHDLIVLEGPAEKGVARQVVEGLPSNRTRLAELLSLREVAGLLAYADFYVGNDSGISHLAAGLGLPSLVLFGPTSPKLWSPRGPHVTVLQNNRSCSACAAGTETPHTCMEGISVELCMVALLRNLKK